MAARIQEVKDQLNKALNDNTKPWGTMFDSLEKKFGVDRLYIFIGKIPAFIKFHSKLIIFIHFRARWIIFDLLGVRIWGTVVM